MSCSSLLKVIKNSIKIKKLLVCSFSSVHESVTSNLIRCAKTEIYLSHFVLLNSGLFLHSNECFCWFAVLYVKFLITASSSAHISHLDFGTSQGMLTVQQRLLLLNSSAVWNTPVYFIKTRFDKSIKQIDHGQSLQKCNKHVGSYLDMKKALFRRCLGVTRGHCTVFIDQTALLKAGIVAYVGVLDIKSRILAYMPRGHWKKRAFRCFGASSVK